MASPTPGSCPYGPPRGRLAPMREAAVARTMARMAQDWPLDGEKLDREALYDRAIRREG
jgi:hypothetical protein